MNKSKVLKQPNNLTQADVNFYSNHFEKYKHSGMSQASYCQQQGIRYNTFVYVRSKLVKAKINTLPPKTFAKFVPVKTTTATTVITDINNAKQKVLLLRLPNNFEVELPMCLLPEQMSSIFKALGVI